VGGKKGVRPNCAEGAHEFLADVYVDFSVQHEQREKPRQPGQHRQ